MNRLLSAFITILAMLTLCCQHAFAAHKVFIRNAAEFKTLGTDPYAEYTLLADIDATGLTWSADSRPFCGSLDGNGHAVSNLSISARNGSCGIFSSMDNAQVRDILFIDTRLLLEPDTDPDSDPDTVLDTTAVDAAGVLCGKAVACNISGVKLYYTAVESESFSGAFGALVGVLENSSIINCLAMESDFYLPQAACVGGLVGKITGSGAVTVSAASGLINAASHIGGIAGSSVSTTASIRNCHSDFDIFGNHSIGGIIGYSERVKLSNCLANGNIHADGIGSERGALTGGIVGDLSVDDLIFSYPSSAMLNVVIGCVAQLTTLEVPEVDPEAERYPGELSTAHRIIGGSVYNIEPEIEGYHDDGLPVYSENRVAETGLSNNYSWSLTAPLDPIIEEASTTTEGGSAYPDDMNRTFLSQRNFRFGDTDAAPWIQPDTNYGMQLYFEHLPVTLTCDTEYLDLYEGDYAEVAFSVVGCSSDFVEVIPTHAYALELLYLEYEPRKVIAHLYARMACETSLMARVGELSAQCGVSMKVGVDNLFADSDRLLSFDGDMVVSAGAGATVAVYSIDGRLVAVGTQAVSTACLPAGHYVAAAGAARLRFVK